MSIPFPDFLTATAHWPKRERVDYHAQARKDLREYFDRRNPCGGFWNHAAARVAASALLDPLAHDDPYIAAREEAECRHGPGRVAERIAGMVGEAFESVAEAL